MQTISEEDAPLIDILGKIAPQSSKTTLRSWLQTGRVTVDGLPVKVGNAQIKKGQKVAVNAKPRTINHSLRIIYEDNDLVAIEKPNGLLSVATAFEQTDTAHALLKEHYRPRPVYVVHRLDQDTSGVMLFALSERGCQGLKDIFEKHAIERKYCAIVEGHVTPTSGTWQSLLFEDANYNVHSTQDAAKGRQAITHYEVQSTSPRCSRLVLTLETGRKNQIRVHCSDAGCPVVGDKKYGAETDPLKRLCLHAFLLALKHPVTGKEMRFTAPVPKSFDRLVRGNKHA